MTAELYKNLYQKTYLPNDFRPKILGNKKVLKIISNWVENDAKTQSPF